ncbi:MAG TPA: CYTH domain-containing protein [Rhodothermales bacterium]|nr:CYTH domain-containing protein [Rhodothermales bacterium]
MDTQTLPKKDQSGKDGWEIERKFLVPALPEEMACGTPASIRQGYLVVDTNGSSVRLREIDDRLVQTIKQGQGVQRREVEIDLTPTQFKMLWPLTEGRRIEKQRYAIPYEGHTIELDVYAGVLDGLVTAEVEFESVEAANCFEPPAWLGKEVTEDLNYTNQCLAINGLP